MSPALTGGFSITELPGKPLVLDLSSQIRDRTCAPIVEAQILEPWTSRAVPEDLFFLPLSDDQLSFPSPVGHEGLLQDWVLLSVAFWPVIEGQVAPPSLPVTPGSS